MLIEIRVKNRVAELIGAPVLVCGNSTDHIDFLFDEEWDAYTAKTARFVYVRDGVVTFQDVPFTGEGVYIPALADITEVRIGVFAEDIVTTTPAVVPCLKSIKCGTGEPEAPTPDVYAELMKLFNTKVLDPNTHIDSELDENSENPVQNKAIVNYLTEVLGHIGEELERLDDEVDLKVSTFDRTAYGDLEAKKEDHEAVPTVPAMLQYVDKAIEALHDRILQELTS